MEERKNEPRECALFYCDRKRRRLCCRDCTEKRSKIILPIGAGAI